MHSAGQPAASDAMGRMLTYETVMTSIFILRSFHRPSNPTLPAYCRQAAGILVIEDEKLLAESVRDLLASKGFETDAAYDGETGAAQAASGSYDLIILDV